MNICVLVNILHLCISFNRSNIKLVVKVRWYSL